MKYLLVFSMSCIVIGAVMLCLALVPIFTPAQNTAEMAHAVTEVSSDVNHTVSQLGIVLLGGLTLAVAVVAVALFGTGSKIQFGGQGNQIGDRYNTFKVQWSPLRPDVLDHVDHGTEFDTFSEVIKR